MSDLLSALFGSLASNSIVPHQIDPYQAQLAAMQGVMNSPAYYMGIAASSSPKPIKERVRSMTSTELDEVVVSIHYCRAFDDCWVD